MKNRATKSVKMFAVGGSAPERQARMHAYLKETHASFKEAVSRSRSLGKSANGVLAGPIVRV